MTLSLYNSLKGGCSQVSVGLFSQVTSSKMSLKPGEFRLDIRKNFFTGKIVKHLLRLPREEVESASLEAFERHVDGAK